MRLKSKAQTPDISAEDMLGIKEAQELVDITEAEISTILVFSRGKKVSKYIVKFA